MKKIYLITSSVILLCLFILFILPFLLNFYVVAQYPKVIQQFSQSNPEVNIKVTSLKRGWFSSKATLAVRIQSQWFKSDLTLLQEIRPGLVILTRSGRGMQKPSFALALLQTYSEGPKMQFHASTFWHLNNTFSTTFNAKKIITMHDKVTLSVSRLSGQFQYDRAKARITGDLRIGAAEIKPIAKKNAPPAKPIALFNQITTKTTFHHKNNIWYGDRTLKIDKMTAYTNQQTVRLNGFTFQTQHTEQNNTSKLVLKMQINQLSNQITTLGASNLQLTINNLNNPALSRLMQAAAQLRNATSANPMTYLQVLTAFNAVLQKGFSVTLDTLSLNTAQGPATATAQWNVPPHARPSFKLDLFHHATLNAKLDVPKVWLEETLASVYAHHKPTATTATPQTPLARAMQAVGTWIQNGMLKETGDRVSMTLTTDKGSLWVNGRQPNFALPNPTPPAQQNVPAQTAPPTQQAAPTQPAPTPAPNGTQP